jgi:glycosyltransferase involved in cell wall biosynthesis
VHVVSPSQWLLDKAIDEKSILKPTVIASRIIPNGVDLSTFRPASKSQVREELQIPKDAFVLLFVAAGSRKSLSQKNLYKDYATIHTALEIVSKQTTGREIVFMALGGNENEENSIGDTRIKFLPYIGDPATIAKYYQAADVYLHAAYAETFGIVIVEALSCGTPVIATGVGGIPELIKDSVTGFLVDMLDAQAMSARILELLNNQTLRNVMGEQAALTAQKTWGLDYMAESYLAFYGEIIANWKPRPR